MTRRRLDPICHVRPPSPRGRPALVAATALMAMTAGGCNVFGDECLAGESRCQGNRLEVCQQNDETGTKHFHLSETCDRIPGGTCRTSTSTATRPAASACVSSEPCLASTCEGAVAVLCHPSGFVQSRTDCAAQMDKICTVGGGRAACTYAVPCPAADGDSFCDADGHRLWSGCRAGYGYPLLRSDCADKGLTCASGNGATECVLAERIACDAQSAYAFCSPDAASIYFCGPSGFVREASPCKTAGTACQRTVSGTSSFTTCIKL